MRSNNWLASHELTHIFVIPITLSPWRSYWEYSRCCHQRLSPSTNAPVSHQWLHIQHSTRTKMVIWLLITNDRWIYYLLQRQVSSLNRLKWIQRYDNFQPTCNILVISKAIKTLLNLLIDLIQFLPWWLNSVFQERLRPFQASACLYHRCRLMVTTWNWTETSVKERNAKNLKTFYYFEATHLPVVASWRWA